MVVTMKKREYMVAESGEVFYTERQGERIVLKSKKSYEEYQEMVEQERKMATTYFEITVDGCYHKLQVVNETAVFKVLNQIKDFDKRVEEQTRYFVEKERAGL